MNKIFLEIKNDKIFLIFYFILIIIAYGFHMFNLTLFGDDWEAIQYNGYQYNWVVSIGRWMELVVWKLFSDNYFVPVFSISFFMLSIYIMAKLFFNAIKIESKLTQYSFILLAALSPIFVEILSFKMLMINVSFGIIFAALSFVFFIKSVNNS